MNKKKLSWNKNNIEIAQAEVEKAIIEADKADRKIYGWIRAMLWSIGFILDEMHRSNKDGHKSIILRVICENLDADGVKALNALRDEWEKEIKDYEAGRHF